MTRPELQKRIKQKEEDRNSAITESRRLYNEIIDLEDQLNMITDDVYRYEEKEESHKEGRKWINVLVGRRYWKEEFKHQDGGESIWIERSSICRINGKPTNILGWPLEYQEI